MSFFSTVLQPELTLIIWDTLILEHSTKVLYATALALFEQHSELLIQQPSMPSFVSIFREPQFIGIVDNIPQFLESVARFNRIVTTEVLTEKFARLTATVRAETQSVSLRRELMQLSNRTHFSRQQLELLQAEFL